MKKIFIVTCAIIMCCAMLLTASANEDTYMFGEMELKDFRSLGIDEAKYKYAFIVQRSGFSPTLYLSTVKPIRDNYARLTLKGDETDALLSYNYENNDWVLVQDIQNQSPLSISLGSDYTVKWATFNYTNSAGGIYVYKDKNFVYGKCDGSSCSATDVNTDNICDDCGSVFAVLRSYDAPDPYTAWTSDRQANFPYAFIYKNEIDANVFIMASTRPYVQDGQIVIDTNGENSSYLKYTQWGNDWRLVESYDDGTSITANTLVSSFNILDTDGNIIYNHDTDFFPVPLWEEMENLTQGEMANKFIPKMGGLIMIVTACGVGCLALLAVLKLFGKRSLIYRS